MRHLGYADLGPLAATLAVVNARMSVRERQGQEG